MAYCIHDVDPAACGTCNPPSELAPSPELWGPLFTAGYYDTCAGCGDGILPGDTIRADGQEGWLCESCGREEYP
jgi:hypothetical protein